jgi:predicted unusual protein kinase regulating ubiquinone biosynthesis (AarF/ABC1/UbiB family)
MTKCIQQIGLLDFGASREYKNSFVDNYMMILKGAAEADRESVMEYSRRIGFLSGYESKVLLSFLQMYFLSKALRPCLLHFD